MEDKIQEAKGVIERAIKHCAKPVLAWSGGKDSMALLHLMSDCGIELPVIFMREPWQPSKYSFQNRIIEQWGLEVHTWHPSDCGFQQNGDEFEVQNHYVFGMSKNTVLTCPTGITEPIEGKPWVCGLDIYGRPKQSKLVVDWDSVFMGQKGCDSDPIYGGDAGTRVHVRVVPDQATFILPLKNWTHEDVWQYIEDKGIPYDEARYEKVNGVWGEKRERLGNCDYVHACVKCIRNDGPRFVECPKYGSTVENVSQMVNWADQTKPTYMED